jgi:hypothetical protein
VRPPGRSRWLHADTNPYAGYVDRYRHCDRHAYTHGDAGLYTERRDDLRNPRPIATASYGLDSAALM